MKDLKAFLEYSNRPSTKKELEFLKKMYFIYIISHFSLVVKYFFWYNVFK